MRHVMATIGFFSVSKEVSTKYELDLLRQRSLAARYGEGLPRRTRRQCAGGLH